MDEVALSDPRYNPRKSYFYRLHKKWLQNNIRPESREGMLKELERKELRSTTVRTKTEVERQLCEDLRLEWAKARPVIHPWPLPFVHQ